MSDVIIAPWTEDQVTALNAFQQSGKFHPFTCPSSHRFRQILVAEADGWRCSGKDCEYQQNWAHAFMADPQMLEDTVRSWEFLVPARPSDPLRDELRRVREELRATRDDLALERSRTEGLRIQLHRSEAQRDLHGRPLVPEREAKEGDATW